jgi:hypothetical protein
MKGRAASVATRSLPILAATVARRHYQIVKPETPYCELVADARECAERARWRLYAGSKNRNADPKKRKPRWGKRGSLGRLLGVLGGRIKQPPHLKRTYRAAVSGVFRPGTFLFRHLRQDGGLRFAICGSNPALMLKGYQPTVDAAAGVLSAPAIRVPRSIQADSGSPPN